VRDLLKDTVERILAAQCKTEFVKQVEAGFAHKPLWDAMEESGFLDALLPEDAGGSALSLRDASPLIELSGTHAVPVPISETMLLRWVLYAAGVARPAGSLTLSRHGCLEGAAIRCPDVPFARTANWVVVVCGGECRLLPVESARHEASSFVLDSTLEWDRTAWDYADRIDLRADLRIIEALIRSLQLAGALHVVMARSLDYANERVQFGKPIGKFQAIQHQLAAMSEQVLAARIAADLAVSVPGMAFDPLVVAIAKARTSEAAAEVAALAHGIHGAIGFTLQYDLQLWTRRLHAWRHAAGSEGYWHTVIGANYLSSAPSLCLDLLRKVTESTRRE
jgi:acyl-CoA dehydrogenase